MSVNSDKEMIQGYSITTESESRRVLADQLLCFTVKCRHTRVSETALEDNLI
jgi:hypothetical protein